MDEAKFVKQNKHKKKSHAAGHALAIAKRTLRNKTDQESLRTTSSSK
jgi:hypothetical protein